MKITNSAYRPFALFVHDNRLCDDPRRHTRTRTWDVRCNLHDDDRAYHEQLFHGRVL